MNGRCSTETCVVVCVAPELELGLLVQNISTYSGEGH